MRGKLFLFLVLLATLPSFAQKGEPLFTGPVTAIAPDGSFELESGHIVFQPNASFSRRTGKASVPLSTLPTPFLGQVFACYGRYERKSNTLHVTHLAEIVPVPTLIASRGIIESVDPIVGTAPAVIRADGHLLRLPAPPALQFEDDLTPAALAANQWISYKGTLQPDGTVDVTEADVWRNAPEAAEAKLRDRETFNPDDVDPAKAQGGLSKALLGVDPKKLPPHDDPALQARLDRIGNTLVPAFQRSLDPHDPTSIPFRFRAVAAGKLHYPIALTSGIILIPYDSIERLPQDTDDQLAALLADSIAVIIEKQKFLNKDKHAALTTASLVSTAASFTPVGVLAIPLGFGGMAAGGVDNKLYTSEMQQSGRVSLWLLHDAGYDITQAPIAWWQISSPKIKPLAEIALPPAAVYLYDQLGTTWRRPAPEP